MEPFVIEQSCEWCDAWIRITRPTPEKAGAAWRDQGWVRVEEPVPTTYCKKCYGEWIRLFVEATYGIPGTLVAMSEHPKIRLCRTAEDFKTLWQEIMDSDPYWDYYNKKKRERQLEEARRNADVIQW